LTHTPNNVKDLKYMGKPTQLKPALTIKPLGILGGGQLARMLALKCHELGLPVAIYSASPDDPAAQVVKDWRKGDLSEPQGLSEFLKSCSVVTFESEFMDAKILTELSKKSGTEIFPSPTLMGALQDRLTQKMLLERHKLRSAPFHNVKDKKAARLAFDQFEGSVVFKKRRFGYDGYGTYVVRNEAALAKFLPLIGKDEHGFIAEKFISFKRELAFVAARSRSGDVVRFPFVETLQENSRCLWVKGPLKPSASLEKVGRAVEAFLKEIDYVGVMGIELFETQDGYLINELAPRVHNSAHYSLDALDLDQFSAHILSVIGAHLDRPQLLTPGFAMMNLLGQGSQTPTWKLPRGVRLHWYGKSVNREGRKMGHYNVLASTPARALALAKKARASFDV
jgi:5-(carboxyamino)imidazole ribonucleotide synthase